MASGPWTALRGQLSLRMQRSLGHEPPGLLSFTSDGMSFRPLGEKAPLIDAPTLAFLFFLTSMDAGEVKDKKMVAGVPFMKNLYRPVGKSWWT